MNIVSQDQRFATGLSQLRIGSGDCRHYGWRMTPGRNQSDNRPIILFDAMCVLCSANAQFVLKYDRRMHFRLASMQSDIGAALYRKFGIDPADPETMIVVDGDTALKNSDAVLAIYASLGWPWRIFSVARIIPRPIRDRIYGWVARNRYRLFGKRQTCWLPPPDLADRLL
jgi:predicted DCC family thiol-disulfide oxidoreductase YuxK